MTIFVIMEKLGDKLKELRRQKKMTLKDVGEVLGIDSTLINRFEKNERIPSKEQIIKLSKVYKVSSKSLEIMRLSQKIYEIIDGEEFGMQALKLCEDISEYKVKSNFSDSLLDEIIVLKKELDGLRPLPIEQLKNLQEFYKIEYTYNSNKIEGNTLTLKETALVVEKGITINGKSMQEHLEAINHAEAIDFIADFVTNKTDFNAYYLKQLHALILRGINKEYAGKYRNVNVRISGAEHTPPEPFMLDKLMEDYFIFYENNKNTMNPVILAAEMHERLVTIHPFIDGNGRTSRLIMNLILMQNGYPIAIINAEKNNRLEYYNTLEIAQVKFNKKPFYSFVAKTVKQSLVDFLKIVK